MSFIYKITNDINDKVYVGKTTTSIQDRFKEHCSDAFRERNEKRPLYNAMKKYGIEHFKIEMIEECADDILSEREVYWIAYYKGYEDGYNATKGGDGKMFYDREKIKDELLINPYPKEVAQKFNCSTDLVYIVAKQYNIETKSKGQERLKEQKKVVYQYDKITNEYIQSFDSTVSAANWCFENAKCTTLNSGVRAHISECAQGKRKSAYGYIWSYEKI